MKERMGARKVDTRGVRELSPPSCLLARPFCSYAHYFQASATQANVVVKNKSTTISMAYTLIDHRNDAVKCSKLCSETTRQQLVVPLEF